jgi:hypothetical protein
MVHEADTWSVTVRGLPVAVEGTDIPAVIDATIAAIRAAATEVNRLRNTRDNYGEWVLGQLIHLSGDAQLRDWLVGGACIHLR